MPPQPTSTLRTRVRLSEDSLISTNHLRLTGLRPVWLRLLDSLLRTRGRLHDLRSHGVDQYRNFSYMLSKTSYA